MANSFIRSVRTLRHQQLLSTAEEMLATSGCRHFSTESLAQNAGVAKGTIYSHFDSQRELLAAVFAVVSERLNLHISTQNHESIEDLVVEIVDQIAKAPEGALGYPCCLRSLPCPHLADRSISALLQARIGLDSQAGTVRRDISACLADSFFRYLLSAAVNHSGSAEERRGDVLSAVRFWLKGIC